MFNFSRDDEGSVRFSKFKYQDVRMMKHKHNPYVGSFHSVPRRDFTEDPRSGNLVSIGNVPMLRHSPPSLTNIFPVVGLSLGLKGLFFHQDNEDNGDVDPVDAPSPSSSPFTLLAPMLSQVNISRIKVLEKNKNLSLTALKKIPIIIFQNNTDAKSPLSPNEVMSNEDCPMCSICLEIYKDGDELRSLNCNHCFHKKCVDIWLLGYFSSGTVNTCRCPQCRGEVSASPDFYESDILDSDTSSSFIRIGESMIINEEISSLSSSAISEIEPPSVSDFLSTRVAMGGNNGSNSIAAAAVESSLDDGVQLVDDDDECLCGSGYSFCDAVDLNALILSDEL